MRVSCRAARTGQGALRGRAHRVAIWIGADQALQLASGGQDVVVHVVAESLLAQFLAVPVTARTGQSEIQGCEFA